MRESDLENLINLDRQRAGCDRSELLRRLYHEDGVRSSALTEDGELSGAFFLRPGREFDHLGPVYASQSEALSVLLDEAAHLIRGRPVLVDALRRESSGKLLESRGLRIQRRLSRMTLHRPVRVLCDRTLPVATAFEWG